MRYLGKQPVEQEIEIIATLLAGAIGQWTNWTPTVTQSGSVTVTVTEAEYCIIGKVCHIYASLAVTGSGSAGSSITIGGMPAAAQPALTSGHTIGTGRVFDASTSTNYWATVWAASGTSFELYDTNTRGAIGNNPNFALANTDVINFTASYRVA